MVQRVPRGWTLDAALTMLMVSNYWLIDNQNSFTIKRNTIVRAYDFLIYSKMIKCDCAPCFHYNLPI